MRRSLSAPLQTTILRARPTSTSPSGAPSAQTKPGQGQTLAAGARGRGRGEGPDTGGGGGPEVAKAAAGGGGGLAAAGAEAGPSTRLLSNTERLRLAAQARAAARGAGPGTVAKGAKGAKGEVASTASLPPAPAPALPPAIPPLLSLSDAEMAIRPRNMPAGMWDAFRLAHNAPQLRAIRSVCEGHCGNGQAAAFTLLQGPPGTGKTRTILSLVSLLLAGAGASSSKGGGVRVSACAVVPRLHVIRAEEPMAMAIRTIFLFFYFLLSSPTLRVQLH